MNPLLSSVTNALSYMKHQLKTFNVNRFSTTCFSLYGHHQVLNSCGVETAVLISSYFSCSLMYARMHWCMPC
jgi:hypothetical protein